MQSWKLHFNTVGSAAIKHKYLSARRSAIIIKEPWGKNYWTNSRAFRAQNSVNWQSSRIREFAVQLFATRCSLLHANLAHNLLAHVPCDKMADIPKALVSMLSDLRQLCSIRHQRFTLSTSVYLVADSPVLHHYARTPHNNDWRNHYCLWWAFEWAYHIGDNEWRRQVCHQHLKKKAQWSFVSVLRGLSPATACRWA